MPTMTDGASTPPADAEAPRRDDSRRRFIISALIGTLAGGLVYVWVLWDLFSGGLSPDRFEPNGNFYDAQAEAILHGHLYFSEAILGIEGFKHDGHYFTYFGILPSLLRIPFLLADPSLNGKLTGPSMLLAWVIIALFTAMLMWRVRILVRGTAPLGNAEAYSYGAVMAVITGGSVLVLLASIPWVYDEDLVWSVAATVGSLFCLLGILERPTKWRVGAAGAFIIAGNLDRLPTAWACVIGAVLVAGWLALGRGGQENKRLAIPLVVLAAVGLAGGCLTNYLKLGQLFGLPFKEQVWTGLNAHRREFLRLSGGKGYGLKFLPTTLWTYLQPFGIRLQTIFPYVTLPATPPTNIGNPFFDATYRTASVPASMPLMFLLTCWGTVVSFLPRASKTTKLLRIPLFAGVVAFGVILVWGYMAPRFEADFLPILILGTAAGLAHMWRKIEGRARLRATADTSAGSGKARHRVRPSGRGLPRLAVGAVTILTLWGIVANFGIAAAPTVVASSPTQTLDYVRTQQTLSNLTGDPLAAYVMTGSRLPYYEPAGKLFVINNCSAADGGLYVSTGETYKYNPVQQQEHDTWLPVQQSAQYEHLFLYTINGPAGVRSGEVPMVTVGPDTIFIETTKQLDKIVFGIKGPGFRTVYGPLASVVLGHSYAVAIDTDTALDQYSIVTFAVGGNVGILGPLPSSGRVMTTSFLAKPGSTPPPITTVYTPIRQPRMGLCKSVLADVKHHG